MDYITIDVGNAEGRLFNIGELFQVLEQVPDNRDEKGLRYTIGIMLIVFILAKLCGENTPYGMAEWAKMRATELQNLFGYHRLVQPSNKTLQRLMDTTLEDKALQKTLRHYLHQKYGGQQSVLVTIDGKTLRGTIPKGKTSGGPFVNSLITGRRGGFVADRSTAQRKRDCGRPRFVTGTRLERPGG